MDDNYFVYIVSNEQRTVLYTGVTNNLKRRVFEHKNKLINGFTSKYNINTLLYYELFSRSIDAITREKQIKAGSRKKKLLLIRSKNEDLRDLYQEI